MVLISSDEKTLRTKNNFKIRFDHFTRDIGFQTCSELKVTLETFRYGEGGDMVGEEHPAAVMFEPINLGRGYDDDEQLSNWWTSIWDVTKGAGDPPNQFKHDGEIILLSWDGSDGPRYEIRRGFLGEFTPFDGLSFDDKAVVVQSCQIKLKHWRGPLK
jgi:phage tail-like protein